MFWDISLAVLAALAQGLTGFLGWRVTMDGVRPERRRLYESLFLIASVVGIASVGFAAYRGSLSSGALSELRHGQEQVIADVEKLTPGTKQAIMQALKLESSYQPFAMALDKPLAWNVTFYNTGNDYATGVVGGGKIFVAPDPSRESQSRIVEEFKNTWTESINATKGSISGATVAPQSMPDRNSSGAGGFWFTAVGPVATRELADKTHEGSQVIFIVDALRYTDSTGTWEIHDCRFLQAQPGVPMNSPHPVVPVFCGVYQDRLKVQ